MSLIDYFRPKTKAKLLTGESVHWIDRHERSTKTNYIRQCVLSFPDWVDRKELRAPWEECRAKERETGVLHVLDHIVPINHPYVCGLTVPWNLQIITKKQNDTKGNRWNPDQTDIFEEFTKR